MKKRIGRTNMFKKQNKPSPSFRKSDGRLPSGKGLTLYNIECLSKNKTVSLISAAIEKEKGYAYARWFEQITSRSRYRSDILAVGRHFVPIQCEDELSHCLYCEETLDTAGIYCDELCETLALEETW